MTATTNGATLQHAIGPTGRFTLRQLSGEVAVRGVDGDTVTVRERTGKVIADVFQVEAGPASLSLSAPDKAGIDFMVFGIGRRSSLDLEVEVPRGAEVTIETASAEVEATGLVGSVRVKTASGDVDLTGLAGTLELDVVSGDVKVVADAPLDVRARTISGDLLIRAPGVSRAVIGTTSGDVRLDALLAGPGPFEVQTVSGDATIVGRSGLRIEGKTVTGDLSSDLPHRRDSGPGRKLLIVGDGATPLGFRSVSGDLRVIAPREALPTVSPMPGAMPVAPVSPVAPIRPVAPVAPAPSTETHDAPPDGSQEVARLDILRALERGEMSVEAAMARLAAIEEA